MKNPSKAVIAELEALKNIKDEDIDYSDIPPVEDTSKFVKVSNGAFEQFITKNLSWDELQNLLHEIEESKIKDRISLRLDHDIVQHFKSQGKKYQTKINDILRAVMIAEKRKATR